METKNTTDKPRESTEKKVDIKALELSKQVKEQQVKTNQIVKK